MLPAGKQRTFKTASRLIALVATSIFLALLTMFAQSLLSVANRPVTRQAIGESLIAQSRPLEAMIVFEEPAWQALANYRAGRYQRAAALYQQLDTVESLYNYGVSLAHLRRWNDAIGAFRVVLDRQKSHADARYNLDLLQQIEQSEKSRPRRNEGADQGGQLNEDKEATGEPNRGANTRPPDEQINADPSADDRKAASAAEDAESPGDAQTDQDSPGGQREPMDQSSLPQASQSASSLAGDPDDKEPPAQTDQIDPHALKARDQEVEIADQLVLRRLTDDAALVLEARMQAIARARQNGGSAGQDR